MPQVTQRPQTEHTAVERLAKELSALSNEQRERVLELANRLPSGTTQDVLSQSIKDTSLDDKRLPRLETLEELDKRHEAEVFEAMQRFVFGNSKPSVEGLQAFVDSTRDRGKIEYPEQRSITRALNFFRSYLGIQFYYRGELCRLSCTPAAYSTGSFRIRRPGAHGKAGRDFASTNALPDIKCRK